MRAKEILYAGPETGGVLKTYFETKAGLRFTPEQWQLMRLIEKLNDRLDKFEQRSHS